MLLRLTHVKEERVFETAYVCTRAPVINDLNIKAGLLTHRNDSFNPPTLQWIFLWVNQYKPAFIWMCFHDVYVPWLFYGVVENSNRKILLLFCLCFEFHSAVTKVTQKIKASSVTLYACRNQIFVLIVLLSFPFRLFKALITWHTFAH